MLKLDQTSDAYPWITMGIGTALFSVSIVLTYGIFLLLKIVSTPLITILLFLIPITVSLIVMDFLLQSGKHWFKMLKIGGLIAGMMGMSAFVGFPILMILYAVGGNVLVMLMSPVLVCGLAMVPGWIFYSYFFGQESLKTVFTSYMAAAVPVTLIFSVFALINAMVIGLALFAGMGAGLGYSYGLKLQKDLLDSQGIGPSHP